MRGLSMTGFDMIWHLLGSQCLKMKPFYPWPEDS